MNDFEYRSHVENRKLNAKNMMKLMAKRIYGEIPMAVGQIEPTSDKRKKKKK